VNELTLDVEAYVDDFGASVVDAYRRGVADLEMHRRTLPEASSRPTAAIRDAT
jgi:hypothetical protein